VHGVTGCGKSRLLQALAAAGAQVLDLEELAAHRGSVLGGLPGRAQPSQKMFESLLHAAMAALDPARPVFVEGESRKIGRLQVPEALIERMRASRCLLLEADLPVRIALLLDEYRHFFAQPEELEAQLDCLARLHGAARIGEWKRLASAGDWEALVARLLEQHYDPAYRRSASHNYRHLADAARLRVSDPGAAAFAGLARGLHGGRMMAATEDRLNA
jgi:tRNA 2-selenouridine synthase